MTHDRSLFDCVMNHLSEDDLSKEWSILEMYETAMGNMRRPVIQSYLSPLSKAYMYFKGIDCIIDYNACGNNQRQALEEIFKKLTEPQPSQISLLVNSQMILTTI